MFDKINELKNYLINKNKFFKVLNYLWQLFLLVIAVALVVGILFCKKEEKISKEKFIIKDVTIYAYCPCEKCNTAKWKGLICNGESMKSYFDKNINICAVDPTLIPLGAKVIYDNKEYLALDIGSSIKGYKIDILLRTHKDTEDFGVKENQIVEVLK